MPSLMKLKASKSAVSAISGAKQASIVAVIPLTAPVISAVDSSTVAAAWCIAVFRPATPPVTST
jgi:hypothetical protein